MCERRDCRDAHVPVRGAAKMVQAIKSVTLKASSEIQNCCRAAPSWHSDR
jgi:hypothetical protein